MHVGTVVVYARVWRDSRCPRASAEASQIKLIRLGSYWPDLPLVPQSLSLAIFALILSVYFTIYLLN